MTLNEYAKLVNNYIKQADNAFHKLADFVRDTSARLINLETRVKLIEEELKRRKS